jgi:hypothetical protein
MGGSGYGYSEQQTRQQQVQRSKHWKITLFVTLEFEDAP